MHARGGSTRRSRPAPPAPRPGTPRRVPAAAPAGGRLLLAALVVLLTAAPTAAAQALVHLAAASLEAGAPGDCDATAGGHGDLIRMIADARASVAAITVTAPGAPSSHGSEVATAHMGTGFVVAAGSTPVLLTNFHVVRRAVAADGRPLPGAAISVRFPLASPEARAEILLVAPEIDLALLTLPDATALPPLRALPFGDSRRVAVGEIGIVLGHPFGLGLSVSAGVISAVGQRPPSGPAVDMLQTDAAINPGNSGGPLMNQRGEVIGVTTSIFNPEAATSSGIGFAVPSALARELTRRAGLAELSGGQQRLEAFGATLAPVADVPRASRLLFGLPEQGVLVVEVAGDGVAARVGLRGASSEIPYAGDRLLLGGDVIVAVDGHPARHPREFAAHLQCTAGPPTLTVLRQGRTVEVPLLGSW